MKVKELMDILRNFPRESEIYVSQPINLEGGTCYIPFDADIIKTNATRSGAFYSPVKGPVANVEEIAVLERKPGKPL